MRIALGIEYDGTHYYGWQRQREVKSVQEALEKALSKIANHPVEVQCAGRTDAGVHGTGQVVHFDTTAERQMVAWTMGQTPICQKMLQYVGQLRFLTIFMHDSVLQPDVIAMSFITTSIALVF